MKSNISLLVSCHLQGSTHCERVTSRYLRKMALKRSQENSGYESDKKQ